MPDVVQILVEFKSVIIAIKGQVFLQEFSNQCVNSIYLNMIFIFSFPQTPLWSDQCNELQPFLRLAESKG